MNLSTPHAWIYLIEAHEEGLFKIGFTARPPRRIRELRALAGRAESCGSDATLTYKHKVYAGSSVAAMWLEQALLEHFAEQRVRGEWFRLARSQAREFPETVRQVQARLTQPRFSLARRLASGGSVAVASRA